MPSETTRTWVSTLHVPAGSGRQSYARRERIGMKQLLAAVVAALTATLVAGAFATAAEAAGKREYVVAYKARVSLAHAKQIVRAHRGTVVRANREARLLLVRAGRGFAR